jgi:exosortase
MRASSSYGLLFVLDLIAVVIWRHSLRATFALALDNEAYTHILLILPICAVLVVLRSREKALLAVPSWFAGSLWLAAASLIGIASAVWSKGHTVAGDFVMAIEMLAVVVWWIGAFALCFGMRGFRDCAFPLLMLLWLVPMPATVLNHVVEGLQQGTASLTHLMFIGVGVPAKQNGTHVSIPGLTIEVSQECSSIRSSILLVLSSMVMSYLVLRSFWGRAVVILASIPLCIAKNGLRVFTLTALTAYVDPETLNSPLHRQGGILFFIFALVGLLGMIWFVTKLELRTGLTAT